MNLCKGLTYIGLQYHVSTILFTFLLFNIQELFLNMTYVRNMYACPAYVYRVCRVYIYIYMDTHVHKQTYVCIFI